MDFLHRPVPHLGKTAFRLGLAFSYGVDPSSAESALERGVNYLFWTSRSSAFKPVIQAAMKKDREKLIIASGPLIGYFGATIRSGCESLLRELGTDYIDVFHLFWLGITSAYTDGTVETLLKLKEEGKIRAIGTSIHDRPRAGRLAEDSAIDLFMLRYNAAHPGAEQDVFPHLEKRKPAVVAYTATAWRKLLKPPKGWDGPGMSAGDCYRFALSNPSVDVCLTGPADRAQLDANLAALEKGPLSAEEMEWIRRYGKAVHG